MTDTEKACIAALRAIVDQPTSEAILAGREAIEALDAASITKAAPPLTETKAE